METETTTTTEATAPPTVERSYTSYEEIVDALRERRATRTDALDLPGIWTQRQKDEYNSVTQKIVDAEVKLAEAKTRFAQATSEANAARARLKEMEDWRDTLMNIRATCQRELDALPNDSKSQYWRTNLTQSITSINVQPQRLYPDDPVTIHAIRLGELLREAGYLPIYPSTHAEHRDVWFRRSKLALFDFYEWQGSLPEIEARIEEFKRRPLLEKTMYEGMASAQLHKALTNAIELLVAPTD